jgi:membrane protein required for colicin V production
MIYDLIVVAILIIATVRGASKGVVWQLAIISALILCFAFAETLSLSLAPLITVKPPLNRWIAMFILYIGFSFACFAAARTLKDWIEKSRYSEYDRHLGSLLGFAKGVLACLVLTFFIVTLSPSARDHILGSHSGHAAALIMDRLHPVMPTELQTILEPYIHQLDQPNQNLLHSDHIEHRPSGIDPDHDGSGEPEAADGHPQSLSDDALSQQIAKLIGNSDQNLVAEVVELLRTISPDKRPELIQQLGSGSPGQVRSTINRWRRGASLEDEQGDARTQLLSEIAAVYFDFPKAQQAFIEETTAQLKDLPPHIHLAVLQDLYADLLNTNPDPDPTTDWLTTLDARVQRQSGIAAAPRDQDVFRR